MDRPDCEICGVSFDSSNHLHDHMAQHLDEITVEQKVLDCENCRRSFFNMDHYNNHNRMVHAPPRSAR